MIWMHIMIGVDLFLSGFVLFRFNHPFIAIQTIALGVAILLIISLANNKSALSAQGPLVIQAPSTISTTGEDTMNTIQKVNPGSLQINDVMGQPLEALRPALVRFSSENPFLELAPVPQHSHEFEGWIREAIKRKNIKSHILTEELQTRLATQINELYQQLKQITETRNAIRYQSIIPEINLQTEVAEKLYSLRRLSRRAEVDDLRVDLDLVNAQAELAKARKQMAIDLDRLDAQILEADRPKDSPDAREATRLQQEIDSIVRKISTIAGLQQACIEMKGRSPQQFGPLIDRLFRKVIDLKKENI